MRLTQCYSSVQFRIRLKISITRYRRWQVMDSYCRSENVALLLTNPGLTAVRRPSQTAAKRVGEVSVAALRGDLVHSGSHNFIRPDHGPLGTLWQMYPSANFKLVRLAARNHPASRSSIQIHAGSQRMRKNRAEHHKEYIVFFTGFEWYVSVIICESETHLT